MPENRSSAFTPLRLGPLTLRNRFVKSGTNEGMHFQRLPTKALLKHHRDIAAGGVGMTTMAYCAVSPDGRTFESQLVMSREAVPHIRAIADAVHAEGAALSAQITHGGAFNQLSRLSTPRPGSASGGFNASGVLTGRLFKRALTVAEMETIAEEFADAARLAREAGCDAVEVHMGHGYLLSQFLSPAENRRKDDYGGTVENRARFPRMVLRRVLDAVGRDMAVLAKICVMEGFKGGATAEDAAGVARLLEADGANMLVLSGGMNVQSPWWIFGSAMPIADMKAHESRWIGRVALDMLKLQQPKGLKFHEMYFLDYSKAVRKAVKMPLGFLGGVASRASIERAMAEGFDAVVLGRALLHDPAFVNRLKAGEIDRTGCTACNRCVALLNDPAGVACVLNVPNDLNLNRVFPAS